MSGWVQYSGFMPGLSNFGWGVMDSCTFNHVSDNLFVLIVQFDTLYGKKAAALYTQVQFLFVCEKLYTVPPISIMLPEKTR